MLYYSEITEKAYDTVDELTRAEKDFVLNREKYKKKRELLAAFGELTKCENRVNALLEDFCVKYYSNCMLTYADLANELFSN